MPETLKATLSIITPVFCAGARPNEQAEIRPLSIRGALRWWYRALDGRFRAEVSLPHRHGESKPRKVSRESLFFGSSAGDGLSSPIRVVVKPWKQGERLYNDRLVPQQARDNGAAYLGYTLYLGGNERRAVPEKQTIHLELSWQWIPTKHENEIRRTWAACLWLWGHLGGLGTRSRRGFGTLALLQWQGWPECNELHPAHGASNPQQWLTRFGEGWKQIRGWFPEAVDSRAEHQHLPADLRCLVAGSTQTSSVAKPHLVLASKGEKDWYGALRVAGQKLQEFRREPSRHRPEKLAAFGLPIRFQSDGLWNLKNYKRSASRLHIRVVQIEQQFHPLFWRAEGPLSPGRVTLQAPRNQTVSYSEANDQLLVDFLRSV